MSEGAVPDSIKIDDGTTANTYSQKFDQVDVGNDDHSLDLGTGVSQETDSVKSGSFRILDPAAWSFLNGIQVADPPTPVTITVTYKNGGTDVFSEALLVATPVFSPTPDADRIWQAVSNAPGTDPTGTPADWNDLGPVVEDEGANVTASTQPDGRDRERFASGQIEHPVHIRSSNYGSVDTATSPLSYAIEHPDGSYRIYDNMRMTLRYAHDYGTDSIRTARMRIFGSDDDFDNLFSQPSAPQDYFYGAAVSFIAQAYSEGTILTRT